jgi:hypothetical protein
VIFLAMRLRATPETGGIIRQPAPLRSEKVGPHFLNEGWRCPPMSLPLVPLLDHTAGASHAGISGRIGHVVILAGVNDDGGAVGIEHGIRPSFV